MEQTDPERTPKKSSRHLKEAVDFSIGENFSEKDFSKFYELTEHVVSYGDFFEIREIQFKKTLEKRTAKIFRKLDMRDKIGSLEVGMELIKNELAMLARLDHPNIVKVLEAFQDQFKVYFVFDELKGKSLFERIMSEGCLPDPMAACISGTLVSVTKYLHSKGIIMRNLRPECIIFESDIDLEIRVVDVSLAIEKARISKGRPDTAFDMFQTMP